MLKPKHNQILLNLFLPLLLLAATLQTGWGQCLNSSQFGTTTAPTNNTPTTITTCAFGGEYNTINSAVAGSTYLFTGTGGSGNYLTIRQGTPAGPVLAFGFSPISATCTASGPLYVHVNTNASCGTDGVCHTTTIQCTSCAGAPDPCTSTTPLSCGVPVSATLSGSGLWSPSSCGFSTPGTEKIYTFTPTTTGLHTLQVNSTSSSGFIDYFYKPVSSGCNATGWTCIDDIFSPTSVSFTLTAGVAYYILLDPETTSSVTQNFQITCPAGFDPCASTPTITCGASTTATISGTGAWSPGSCGFSTPGQEKIYVFTPVATGIHNLQVTSVTGGYIDYFYKPVSGGCNATGWICVDDIAFTGSFSMGTLTAGTPYYILLDPESTSSVTQTFQINCPVAGPPPCLAGPTSPTNGQINVCPSSTQNLSWPAAAGATSYDVYFGTTPVPLFVGNTAATSFSVSTPSNGLYYWQIQPRNANGPATGCSVWSFTKGDNVAPTITCPASVVANNSPSTACSAVVTYGAISATDNCSPPNITLFAGLPSGSVFPVGVNTIIYRATDGVGNSNTCSFTVTVNDATAPTITCPPNIVKNNDPGFCFSVTTYASPTATDNCGISSVLQTTGLGSGASFPVGTTTNTFRATDPTGNSSTCSFTVKVNDVQLPAITCPPTLTLSNDPGDCGRAVSWVGQAAATDNCAVGSNSSNNPGYLPVGTHIITHTVSDISGNQTTCSQTVIVKDLEYPFVTCPPNISVTTDDFDCIATVNFAANAGDNCPGFTLDYSTPPFSAFDIGTNTVTATITDGAGNESNCDFKVVVKTRVEICNDYDDDCDGLIDETDDWAFTAKLFAPDGTPSDKYGAAVDIDGDWAIVGAQDAAYILHRGPNGWEPSSKLLPGVVQPGDEYGASVALDGSLAVVGAPSTDGAASDQGAAYVFAKNSSNSWNLVKTIGAADASAGDRFGGSVAVDSFTLAIGSSNNDQTAQNAGAAYIFYKDQVGVDSFGQVAKLLAATGNADDNMGTSVAIDGDNVAVGATGVDGFFQNSGAAYIFSRNQNGTDAWGQVARMRSQQSKENDNFGTSVGISGGWAIVGASNNDLQDDNSGSAFIFKQNMNGINNSWGQRNILYDFNGTDGENYGSSVAIEGNYAVVGAKNDNPYGFGSGRVFVYERQPDDNWLLIDQLADSGSQISDNLGSDVAISGRSIVAGMPLDDNGTSLDQGAVTFFEGICADELRQQAYDRNENLASGVRSYPVPFSDVLNIELEGIVANDVQIQVINALGQSVADIHRGAVQSDMTLQWRPESNIADGIYFLRLRTENKTTTQTIVLSRQR
ncbi:MAG: HYR domain-containing protein [Saprospiraceae bacterium]|nr:HYR domain-containing protein [Saprospiraceae bacterium]